MNKNTLMEELIMLCEVRGELSEQDNAEIERRISEIEKQLVTLE
jgi:hypothetical protein